MRKNKVLPTVKISTEQYEEIQKAIKTFNSNNLFELHETGFRRLAYKVLCEIIQSGEKIPVNFKLTIK